MTTKGIMKTYEDNDCVYYRTGCSCGEPTHDLTISMTKDMRFGDITWTFYTNTSYYSPSMYDTLWDACKSFIERIKAATKLLFTGFLEYESEFIIDDPEVMQNIINVLNEGKEHLSKIKEDTKKCKCSCKDKLSKTSIDEG